MNYKASDVDGSWAVDALHETIKEFNEQSREQTAQMLWLTKIMAVLTAIMLIGLALQIYLAIWPPATASNQSGTAAVTAPQLAARLPQPVVTPVLLQPNPAPTPAANPSSASAAKTALPALWP